MKKWKIDRIISVATLVTALIAIVLVLKKPQPVAQPQAPAAAAANAQSFQTKVQQLDQPKEPGQAPAEVRHHFRRSGAALAQAAGAFRCPRPVGHDQLRRGFRARFPLLRTPPSLPDSLRSRITNSVSTEMWPTASF